MENKKAEEKKQAILEPIVKVTIVHQGNNISWHAQANIPGVQIDGPYLLRLFIDAQRSVLDKMAEAKGEGEKKSNLIVVGNLPRLKKTH